jgi:hypothetical protein
MGCVSTVPYTSLDPFLIDCRGCRHLSSSIGFRFRLSTETSWAFFGSSCFKSTMAAYDEGEDDKLFHECHHVAYRSSRLQW